MDEEREKVEWALPTSRAAIRARIDKLSDRIDSILEDMAAAKRDYERHLERHSMAVSEHNQLVSKLNVMDE